MSPVAQRSYGAPLVVELGERSYPIYLADGPVVDPRGGAAFWRDLLVGRLGAREVALVTNTTLAPRFGGALQEAIESLGLRVVPIVIEDGERFKTADTLAAVHDAMLAARLDRKAVVVALGGGVVGDLAGFAAATYQRGVRFVQVPTTLLSQVDSSVGGKTGVNHRLGKNMIGAFHQPSAVVIDLATLDSLPAREFSAGLAEVVKYGAGLDADFFAWLEDAMPRLLERDAEALAHAIRRSCELKAAVVGADEREAADRALLNLGHTFGHAIEGATGYGTWLHGEAVAAGMVLAAGLSMRIGLIDPAVEVRVERLLAAARLPVKPPALSAADWLRWMSSDKKAEGGRLRFVLLDALGGSRVAPVNDAVLAAFLDDVASGQAVAHAS